MGKIKDLAGQRFGKLTATRQLPERIRGAVAWECICSCGNTVVVPSKSLIGGNTQSCGCSRMKDLTGQRFGRLTAIRLLPERLNGSTVWECLCDCGNTTEVQGSELSAGRTRSCGCSHIKNLAGRRFGRLTAIKPLPERRNGGVVWECLCDCGNTAEVRRSGLLSGQTKSCGCLNDEGRRARRGPLSSNWNPSLTDEQRVANRHYPEYAKWREAVFERDCYTCQCCGERGGNLNAHHIEAYNSNRELRTTLSNGVTLCKKHHDDFHHQYGHGNNTKKQFEEWMNNRETNND
jgi:PII-like signaling protein